MVVGNIEFVAWTVLSDAFKNMATLLSHTYFYNGQPNETLSVQLGQNEEFDLTMEEYKKLEEEYPKWDIDKIIDFYYQDVCEKQHLMLCSYDQLEQLERLVMEKQKRCFTPNGEAYPRCFIPNGEVYPLCKGKDNKCHNCGLYENYEDFNDPY